MKYRVTIPKPCPKNWQQMNTVKKEKNCNKIVFDLTTLTDEQLVDKTYQKERMNERVKSNLLNRNLKTLPQKISLGLINIEATTNSSPFFVIASKKNTILVIPYLSFKTTTLNISKTKHTYRKIAEYNTLYRKYNGNPIFKKNSL